MAIAVRRAQLDGLALNDDEYRAIVRAIGRWVSPWAARDSRHGVGAAIFFIRTADRPRLEPKDGNAATLVVNDRRPPCFE